MNKELRNRFRMKKENGSIKDRVIRDIRKLFEYEEDYYKPVRVNNFQSNNYVEYETNDDRNKNHQLRNILIKLDHA